MKTEDCANLYTTINNMLKIGYVNGCSINTSRASLTEEELLVRHVEQHNGLTLINIKNPWGG